MGDFPCDLSPAIYESREHVIVNVNFAYKPQILVCDQLRLFNLLVSCQSEISFSHINYSKLIDQKSKSIPDGKTKVYNFC